MMKIVSFPQHVNHNVSDSHGEETRLGTFSATHLFLAVLPTPRTHLRSNRLKIPSASNFNWCLDCLHLFGSWTSHNSPSFRICPASAKCLQPWFVKSPAVSVLCWDVRTPWGLPNVCDGWLRIHLGSILHFPSSQGLIVEFRH